MGFLNFFYAMQIQVFKIRVERDLLAQDQQNLNDFLQKITFKKSSTQFVEDDEQKYWSVLIHYEENESDELPKLNRKTFDDLEENDKKVYLFLKQWRTEKAEQLNMKNYLICHNSELIDIAQYRPSTMDELQQIKGFGKLKANKFGEDILALLNAV